MEPERDERNESTESVSTSERRRSTQDDSDDRNDRNDNFSNTFMSALMMSALMGSRSEHTRSGSGCPCGRDHGQELSSAIDRYANITAASNRLRRSTSPDDSDSSDAESETKHEDVD